MVIADPKLTDLAVYKNADILTPNLQELSLAHGSSLSELDLIGEAASSLAKTHKIGAIITTLSSRGILSSRFDGTKFYRPAMTRDVFDVSGAGDTVLATISAALACGSSLETAVSIANHAAGIAVGKSGTAVVTPGEILADMPVSKPLMDEESLLKLSKIWRESDKKIAFANGCFDLLHPGHISLLKKAADVSDKLVIGLNSDASVKRLKGASRPLQPLEKRAAALNAFDIVDAVITFDEDTPQKLISLLQPDFIVKGGDYKPDDVVGSEIVKKLGGKVIIVPIYCTYSTSKLADNH